jgi:hypothetical protein
MGLEKGAQLQSWPRTTIYQAEMYAIKVCIMENIEKATQVRTSTQFILTVRQPSRPLRASR